MTTSTHLIEIIQLVDLTTSMMHLQPVSLQAGWEATMTHSPKTMHWHVIASSVVAFLLDDTPHHQIFFSHKIHSTIDPTYGG